MWYGVYIFICQEESSGKMARRVRAVRRGLGKGMGKGI